MKPHFIFSNSIIYRIGFGTIFSFSRPNFGGSYLAHFSTVLRRSFSDVFLIHPTSFKTILHPLVSFVWTVSVHRKLLGNPFRKYHFFVLFFSLSLFSLIWNQPNVTLLFSLFLHKPAVYIYTLNTPPVSEKKDSRLKG